MGIKLTSIKRNLAAEREGEWQEIFELPGVSLKVRSIHYGPFQTALGMVQKKLQRQYGDKVPPDILFAENGKLYHEHLLLDWRGFDEPYTPERALEVLTDDGFRELHEHIRRASSLVGAAEVDFLEDATKNSEAPSATS